MIPGVYADGIPGMIGYGVLFSLSILLAGSVLNRRRPRSLRGASNPKYWTWFLCLSWVVVVFYGEVATHFVHSCSFRSGASQGIRLMVLADPQIVDPYAYPHLPSWAHWWVAQFCDVQLRRSFRAAILVARPDAAVILGDLLWGPAYYSTPSTWDAAVDRLNAIFGPPMRSDPSTRQALFASFVDEARKFKTRVPTFVISGNHDIGMYMCGKKLNLLQLYRETFGPLNFVVETGLNATLVGVASPVLQDRYCNHEEREEVERWVKELGAKRATQSEPALLFEHIPMNSPLRYQEPCDAGKGRKKDYFIRHGQGVGYENILNDDIADLLLNNVNPSLVMTGDAHDYCETRLKRGILDMTVPSFSWMEGTFHHGYMLVSVVQGEIHTQLCWQPQQLQIYLFYAVFGVLTLIFQCIQVLIHVYRDKLPILTFPILCAKHFGTVLATALTTFALIWII